MPLGNLARPGSTFDDPTTFRPLAERPPGRIGPRRPPAATWTARASTRPSCTPPSGSISPRWRTRRPRSPWPPRYNDWLAGYCAADPRRLFGVAMLPLQDPAAAAQRAPPRRRPSSGSSPASSAPTPAGAARCPTGPTTWCGRRPRSSTCPSASTRAARSSCRHSGRTAPSTHSCSTRCRTRSKQMLACAQLIAFGTLERHPGLRPLFLESSGGWAPFWLERLDEQATVLRRLLPRHGAAAVRVLRPAVRDQLRGGRTHPALAGAVRRRGAHRLGQRLPPPRRHLSRRSRCNPRDRRPLPRPRGRPRYWA